ncbi:MAG: hypothetical protein ACTTI0_08725 [Treponema sp.]
MTDMNETNNTEKLEDQGDFESVNHQPLQAPVGTDTAPRSQPAAQQHHNSMWKKIKAFFAEILNNLQGLDTRLGATEVAIQQSTTELKGHVDGKVNLLVKTQKKLADTFNALNDTFHSLENSINDPETGITAQLVQKTQTQLTAIQEQFDSIQKQFAELGEALPALEHRLNAESAGRKQQLEKHIDEAAQWATTTVNTHTDEAVKGVNGHIDNTVRRATDEVRDHVTAVVDKQTQQLQTNLNGTADQQIQHLQQELHNKIDATSKEETELIREAMGTIKTEIGKIGQGMQTIYNGIIQNAAKSQAESNQKLDLSNQKLDTILTVLTQQLENFKAEVQRLEGEKSHLTQERDEAREQGMQLSSVLGKKKEQIAALTQQYNTSEKECTEQKRITEPYASFTPDYKNLLGLTLQCESLHELLAGITNPENTEDMLKFLLIFGSEQSFALKVYTVMREYKKLHKEPLSDAERTLVSAINSFYRQNRQLEFDVFEIAESVDGVIKFDKNKMQDMERPADTVMRGVEVIYVPTLRRDAAAIAFKAIVKGIK